MFRSLDLWIIDKYGLHFGDWLQRIFRTSNYTLAKWVLLFGTGLAVAAIAVYTVQTSRPVAFFSLLVIFLELGMGVVATQDVVRHEQQYLRKSVNSLLPDLRDGRYLSVEIRRFMLFIGIFRTVILLVEFPAGQWDHIWQVHVWSSEGLRLLALWVMAIALYILACPPRPPAREAETEKEPVLQPT